MGRHRSVGSFNLSEIAAELRRPDGCVPELPAAPAPGRRDGGSVSGCLTAGKNWRTWDMTGLRTWSTLDVSGRDAELNELRWPDTKGITSIVITAAADTKPAINADESRHKNPFCRRENTCAAHYVITDAGPELTFGDQSPPFSRMVDSSPTRAALSVTVLAAEGTDSMSRS